jgi:hypothetical protein
VLVLREAGRLSLDYGHEYLHPDTITDALKGIQARIDAHAKAPAPASSQAKIVSAGAVTASTQFVDVTEASGINFRHRHSDWLARRIRTYSVKDGKPGDLTVPPAFQGSGIATEDFDNDGWPDVLLLSGLGNKLYRNNGNGTFTDITAQAGIDWRRPDGNPGEPRQAIVADFDNDGLQDILITYVDDLHRLYRNLGNGRFEDVTDRAGLGGKGLVVGPDASKDELADLATRLRQDPRGWIAQPVVQLSTIPTLVEDGMRPRHADLRPFAVNDGTDVWVLPGGLTRVALPEGELVVNSSQGGGSKDTWIVGHEPLHTADHNIQDLVADQAAITTSIPIITESHLQDHNPQDAPRKDQQEQQQQALSRSSRARSARIETLAADLDTPPSAATRSPRGSAC